ncbi:MAG TPA: hypothetical protein PL131_13850 [Methylotenera sp.]|nr:hypothetical protein [Methylotenera sp.]HPN02262.1 hypothetical protein [Methylotenera sp.]
MLDFYECQPQALQKSTKVSKEEFVQWVFEGPFSWRFDAIKNVQSIEALALSFSQAYQGDRVLPLITGLYTMLLQAYGGKNEYTFKVPNPQNLSIATRNIDIVTAKLLMENQENNYFDVNETCRIKVRQALNELAKQVNIDASKIDSSTQTSKLINPLEKDANTIEFIPF